MKSSQDKVLCRNHSLGDPSFAQNLSRDELSNRDFWVLNLTIREGLLLDTQIELKILSKGQSLTANIGDLLEVAYWIPQVNQWTSRILRVAHIDVEASFEGDKVLCLRGSSWAYSSREEIKSEVIYPQSDEMQLEYLLEQLSAVPEFVPVEFGGKPFVKAKWKSRLIRWEIATRKWILGLCGEVGGVFCENFDWGKGYCSGKVIFAEAPYELKKLEPFVPVGNLDFKGCMARAIKWSTNTISQNPKSLVHDNQDIVKVHPQRGENHWQWQNPQVNTSQESLSFELAEACLSVGDFFCLEGFSQTWVCVEIDFFWDQTTSILGTEASTPPQRLYVKAVQAEDGWMHDFCSHTRFQPPRAKVPCTIIGEADSRRVQDPLSRQWLRFPFDSSSDSEIFAKSPSTPVLNPSGGEGLGLGVPYESGSLVWVGFLNDNLQMPVILGSFASKKSQSINLKSEGSASDCNRFNGLYLYSKEQQGLEILDKGNHGDFYGIYLSDSSGRGLKLDAGNKHIALRDSLGERGLWIREEENHVKLKSHKGWELGFEEDQNRLVLASPAGFTLQISEEEELLILSSPGEEAEISLAADGKMELRSQNDILVHSDKELQLKAQKLNLNGKSLELNIEDQIKALGKKIEVIAQEILSLKSAQGLELDCGGSLQTQCLKHLQQASTTMELKATTIHLN